MHVLYDRFYFNLYLLLSVCVCVCLCTQECLERFLQGTGGLQNRELLMVHYLQQANYVPALQLNQALKMNVLVKKTLFTLTFSFLTVGGSNHPFKPKN